MVTAALAAQVSNMHHRGSSVPSTAKEEVRGRSGVRRGGGGQGTVRSEKSSEGDALGQVRGSPKKPGDHLTQFSLQSQPALWSVFLLSSVP